MSVVSDGCLGRSLMKALVMLTCTECGHCFRGGIMPWNEETEVVAHCSDCGTITNCEVER